MVTDSVRTKAAEMETKGEDGKTQEENNSTVESDSKDTALSKDTGGSNTALDAGDSTTVAGDSTLQVDVPERTKGKRNNRRLPCSKKAWERKIKKSVESSSPSKDGSCEESKNSSSQQSKDSNGGKSKCSTSQHSKNTLSNSTARSKDGTVDGGQKKKRWHSQPRKRGHYQKRALRENLLGMPVGTWQEIRVQKRKAAKNRNRHIKKRTKPDWGEAPNGSPIVLYGGGPTAIPVNNATLWSDMDQLTDEEIQDRVKLLHSLGICQPCQFHGSAKGCENGRRCKFCHECPRDFKKKYMALSKHGFCNGCDPNGNSNFTNCNSSSLKNCTSNFNCDIGANYQSNMYIQRINDDGSIVGSDDVTYFSMEAFQAAAFQAAVNGEGAYSRLNAGAPTNSYIALGASNASLIGNGSLNSTIPCIKDIFGGSLSSTDPMLNLNDILEAVNGNANGADETQSNVQDNSTKNKQDSVANDTPLSNRKWVPLESLIGPSGSGPGPNLPSTIENLGANASSLAGQVLLFDPSSGSLLSLGSNPDLVSSLNLPNNICPENPSFGTNSVCPQIGLMSSPLSANQKKKQNSGQKSSGKKFDFKSVEKESRNSSVKLSAEKTSTASEQKNQKSSGSKLAKETSGTQLTIESPSSNQQERLNREDSLPSQCSTSPEQENSDGKKKDALQGKRRRKKGAKEMAAGTPIMPVLINNMVPPVTISPTRGLIFSFDDNQNVGLLNAIMNSSGNDYSNTSANQKGGFAASKNTNQKGGFGGSHDKSGKAYSQNGKGKDKGKGKNGKSEFNPYVSSFYPQVVMPSAQTHLNLNDESFPQLGSQITNENPPGSAEQTIPTDNALSRRASRSTPSQTASSEPKTDVLASESLSEEKPKLSQAWSDVVRNQTRAKTAQRLSQLTKSTNGPVVTSSVNVSNLVSNNSVSNLISNNQKARFKAKNNSKNSNQSDPTANVSDGPMIQMSKGSRRSTRPEGSPMISYVEMARRAAKSQSNSKQSFVKTDSKLSPNAKEFVPSVPTGDGIQQGGYNSVPQNPNIFFANLFGIPDLSQLGLSSNNMGNSDGNAFSYLRDPTLFNNLNINNWSSVATNCNDPSNNEQMKLGQTNCEQDSC